MSGLVVISCLRQILRYAHIWGVGYRHVQIYLVYSTALSDVNVLAVYLNIKSTAILECTLVYIIVLQSSIDQLKFGVHSYMLFVNCFLIAMKTSELRTASYV
jgi:hypothetical protein